MIEMSPGRSAPGAKIAVVLPPSRLNASDFVAVVAVLGRQEDSWRLINHDYLSRRTEERATKISEFESSVVDFFQGRSCGAATRGNELTTCWAVMDVSDVECRACSAKSFWYAPDLTRQLRVCFRPHMAGFLALEKEIRIHVDHAAQDQENVVGRAEVRLVAAHAFGSDHDCSSSGRGWCGPVHDYDGAPRRQGWCGHVVVGEAGSRLERVEQTEILRLQAEVARLTATIVEQAIELAVMREKAAWG